MRNLGDRICMKRGKKTTFLLSDKQKASSLEMDVSLVSLLDQAISGHRVGLGEAHEL